MKNDSGVEDVKKIFSRCHRCNSKKLKYAKGQVIIDPILESPTSHNAMVCVDCTALHFIENGQIAFQWDKSVIDNVQITHCPSDYDVAIENNNSKGRISGHDLK